nr:hypothetical protein Iba_chr02fCG0800 [Ipomoea batatas]
MLHPRLARDLFAADPCLYWDQLQFPNSGGRHWKFDARFHLYSSSHFQDGEVKFERDY